MSRLFIVNPLSARVAKKGAVLETLADELDIDCLRLDSFDGLPAAVTEAAKTGVSHVVIEGGDGTVQGILTAFLQQSDRFDALPSFTIVPAGMTNQVAKNIGLKSTSAKAVKSALSRDLTPQNVPLLKVTDDKGASYAGFLFSTGAIPQITRYTTGQIHKKGIGGSAAVFFGILKGLRGDDETLMKLTPVSMTGLYEGPHLGTVVTTLPSLIMGLDPFWGTEAAPLRLTWVTGQYRRLARNVISLWVGRKSKDRSQDGLYSKCVETLSYDYSGDIVLDGEFLSVPSGKFTVTVTPPVTFLR